MRRSSSRKRRPFRFGQSSPQRLTKVRAERRSDRLDFEKLEDRRVLNGRPVALDDLDFFTAVNTTLTISLAADGVVDNDFDAEGSSLSATKVDDVGNGSLTFNSNGTFTYIPTTDFEGIDSFTYTISDGTDTSALATVNITVGDGLSSQQNYDSPITQQMLNDGVVTQYQPLGGGMNLVYRSDAEAVVIIPVETILAPGTSIPNSINAELTIDSVSSGTVSYNVTGLATGEPLRFVLQSMPTNSTTGMYDWSMDVDLVYSGSTETYTFSGQKAIVNRSDSEFGYGWWLDGLDRLHISTEGALLVNGNGTTHWFEKDGSSWNKAQGDLSYSTLTESGYVYTLTDKFGNTRVFNASGYLTSIKRVNNTVASLTFTYDGNNRISKITDEFSREYNFTYNSTSGLLESVDDFFGRDSSLTHSTDRLTSVTITEETFTGYTAPTWSMTWTSIGSDYYLNRVTSPGGSYVDYVFDSTSRRLSEIRNADHTGGDPSAWKLYPAITEGLHVTGSTISVPTVDDSNARYVNELNNTFEFTTDRYGNLTSFTDALDATSTFEFDAYGQLFRATGADPDGAGSQSSPVTKYGYNSSGDNVVIVNPDATTITATFDSTLHLPLTITNELSDTDTYEYFTDGDLKSWTDADGNKWQYTYDSHGNMLTETSPDPDGGGAQSAIVTTYEYDTTYYYRLTEVTFADSNTQEWTYTTRDQIASFTDELGNVTSYTYDPLERMLTATLPDPDGAGGQSSPVYTWTYGSNLLVATETDPLSNVTSYTYDSRHRLTELTLPDPDGGGSLSSPEYTWTYNKISLVTSETRPEFNGVDIDYTYNANGQLTEVSGPVSGQDTEYDYDALGRLIELTQPNGRIIEYAYDSRGRLTTVTDDDPDGAGPLTNPVVTYAYDNAGQLTSVTDPLGRVTSYAYADNGWLESYTRPDPDGSGSASAPVHSYDYDALGRKIEYTDAAGRETKYTWNNRHQITRITDPDPDGTGWGNPLTAPYTDYDYDDAGRLIEVTAPGSRETSYTYDNLGRRLTTTLPDPDGAGAKSSPIWTWTYDAVGNVLTETDPLSHTTTWAYDNLYRTTSVTMQDPDMAGPLSSPVWSYTYNDYNQLASITNPMSQTTSFGYDTAGRQTTVTDPLSNVTTTAYDVMDRVSTVTLPDPDGGGSQTASVTTYSYDLFSRVTEVEDAEAGSTFYTYDAVGRMISLEDPTGNQTFWAFDNLDRVTLETNELGDTRSFYYNEMDRLIRKMDRLGRTTLYGFHGYTETEHWYAFSGTEPKTVIATTTEGTTGTNEVQTITLADTSNGTFMLGFDGQTTAPLDYDATAAEVEAALEALPAIDDVTVTLSSGTWTVTFGGDQAETNVSQLHGAVALGGDGTLQRIITYTYDEEGNLVNADDNSGSAEYAYTVDKLGRITSVEETIGGLNSDITVDFDYDAANNRTEMAVELVVELFPVKEYLNEYTYDALNRLDHVTQESQSGGHAVADKRVNYVYNSLSQATYINRFENLTATEPALRTKFTYDSAGRTATIQHRDVDSSSTSTLMNQYEFTYDNVHRITEIDSTFDGVSTYTFDKLHQVTGADHDTGRTDESYTYDDSGNRTGGDYVVTANNQTTESTGFEYEYDAEGNRILRTDTSDDSYEVYSWDHRNRLTNVSFYNASDVLTKEIDYYYDMFGRMVRRTLDSNGATAGGVSNTYWGAFDRIHATLEFDRSTASDITHRYLWGQGPDNLLADEVVTSTSSEGDILWSLSDQVGTIRDIGRWDSGNTEFEIANHRVYNTFGELESETDSSVDLAFGFNGKWVDEETGLTHHLHRWFDAAIGKWASEDPIGFAAGDANVVRFVGNKALSHTDPNGLDEYSRSIPGNTGTGDTARPRAAQLPQRQQQQQTTKKPDPIVSYLTEILNKSGIQNNPWEPDNHEDKQAGNDCDDNAYYTSTYLEYVFRDPPIRAPQLLTSVKFLKMAGYYDPNGEFVPTDESYPLSGLALDTVRPKGSDTTDTVPSVNMAPITGHVALLVEFAGKTFVVDVYNEKPLEGIPGAMVVIDISGRPTKEWAPEHGKAMGWDGIKTYHTTEYESWGEMNSAQPTRDPHPATRPPIGGIWNTFHWLTPIKPIK